MDRERLLLSALHVCRQEARRWRHVPIEQEDLEGEAVVALVKAADRYEVDRGVPFPAYARYAIRGALLDLVRNDARRAALDDGEFVNVESLDATSEEGNIRLELVDPGSLEEVVEARSVLSILNGMPARERYVILRTRVDGVPAGEVGDELGIAISTVYRLAERAGLRLRIRRGDG